MLDTRETNILRHALAARPGPIAESLARRLADGPVAPAALSAGERAEAADALDDYIRDHASFSGIAAEAARQLRAAA